LDQFIQYLQNGSKEQQLTQKSFALRQFICSKQGDHILYPMTYLDELRKIGATLHPSSSPEFIGKLRNAFYEENHLILRVLISFGVDVTKIMSDLFRKGFHFEPDILKIFFSSNRININKKYYRNAYPIILAAIFLDKYEIWHVLKDRDDIDWSYTDNKGRNLAYWATCCNSQNINNFLSICQAKKLDFDKRDFNGNRAASIAVRHRKIGVLKYLVEECKVDINAQNNTGITLGHDICERSLPLILEYLLTKGLQLDIKNCNGETALDYAKMYYSQNIVNVLIANKLWNE